MPGLACMFSKVTGPAPLTFFVSRLIASMQLRTVKLASLAMALIGTGCGSLLGQAKASMTLIDIPVHHFHGAPEDVKTTWYRAYVLTTNSLAADEAIEVIVRGEVGRLGPLSVPRGTTVLEAIKMAGGFTELARSGSVLIDDGKHRHRLNLHRQTSFLKRSRVWFGDGAGDFVLEPGATIYVFRGV